MKNLLVYMGLCGVLSLAGCSSMVIRSEQRADIDLSGTKSYKWSDATPMRLYENVDYDLLISVVRKTADQALQSKGFVRRDGKETDLVAGFFAMVESKKEWEPDYGMTVRDKLSPGWMQTVSQEGTLMLYLMDVKKKQVVWVGAATDRTNPSLDLETKKQRVTSAVKAIIDQLPAP